MATTLTQLRPLSISTPPPADNDTSIPRRDSTSNRRSFINTSPEQRLVRRSSNRLSWSSASNTSPTDVPSPLSDTTSAGPPRKFRLPVRVSTQPSFGTSDSSPQARRRSLSLSSDPKTDNKASDSKRRTRNLYLSQLDEDKAEELRKSPRPSPRVASPPPPPYEKVPASSTETSKVSDKPKDITPKPADAPKPAPVAAAPPPPRSPAQTPKSPRKQPPAPATTAPAPRTTITPVPQKMSSSSSP